MVFVSIVFACAKTSVVDVVVLTTEVRFALSGISARVNVVFVSVVFACAKTSAVDVVVLTTEVRFALSGISARTKRRALKSFSL